MTLSTLSLSWSIAFTVLDRLLTLDTLIYVVFWIALLAFLIIGGLVEVFPDKSTFELVFGRYATRTTDRPVSRPSVPAPTVTERAIVTARPASYLVPVSSPSLPVDAFLDLVETGDVRPLSEAYLLTRQEGLAAAARQRSATPPRLLDHLAVALQRVGQPRPLSDYAPCQQIEVVLHELARLYDQANAVIKAKDGLTNTVIQHGNRRLDYQLAKVKREAAIVEQQAAKAKHELALRAAEFDEAVQREARKQTETVVNPSQEPKSALPLEDAALAEAKRQTRLSEEALKQALIDARIQGLRNPEAARRARAQRQAAREGRAAEDQTSLLDELEHRRQRELKKLAKTHGTDSDVYQRACNTWDATMEAVATSREGERE